MRGKDSHNFFTDSLRLCTPYDLHPLDNIHAEHTTKKEAVQREHSLLTFYKKCILLLTFA